MNCGDYFLALNLVLIEKCVVCVRRNLFISLRNNVRLISAASRFSLMICMKVVRSFVCQHSLHTTKMVLHFAYMQTMRLANQEQSLLEWFTISLLLRRNWLKYLWSYIRRLWIHFQTHSHFLQAPTICEVGRW